MRQAERRRRRKAHRRREQAALAQRKAIAAKPPRMTRRQRWAWKMADFKNRARYDRTGSMFYLAIIPD